MLKNVAQKKLLLRVIRSKQHCVCLISTIPHGEEEGKEK